MGKQLVLSCFLTLCGVTVMAAQNDDDGLGGRKFRIEEGAEIESVTDVVMDWDQCVEPVEGAEWVLEREGIPVRRWPIGKEPWECLCSHIFVDFYTDLFSDLKFEAGVHYTLVLPEGSVVDPFNPSMVNKEERLNFIGACKDEFAIVPCSDLEIEYSSPYEISTASYIVDRPMVFAKNEPKLFLLDYGVGRVAEADAHIQMDGLKTVITGDFKGYELDPTHDYHVILPEETVIISCFGQLYTNSAYGLGFSYKESGVGSLKVNEEARDAYYTLQGVPVKNPLKGEMYVRIRDGKSDKIRF